MAFVAILHIFAYPLAPYKVWRRPRALENHVVGKTNTYTGIGMACVALVEMVNVIDLFEGIYRAFKYLLFDLRHRHHEIGYMNNHVKPQGNLQQPPNSSWSVVTGGVGRDEERRRRKRQSEQISNGQLEFEKPVAAVVKV